MKNLFITSLCAALSLAPASLMAQPVGFPAPPPKVSPAQGAIDFHVHSEPDVFGRSMDDIDVAVLASRKGMRGLVLKNHVTMTADRAVLVMKIVPGIEVFGGIVLNNAVGGINPAAVEWCTACLAAAAKSYGCRPLTPTNTSRPWWTRRLRASWLRPTGSSRRSLKKYSK